MDDARERADARLAAALRESELEDPRDFYRERLKLLRERSPAAFQDALRYYEDELLPSVAAEDSDPVREWFAYGRRLAELTAPGRLVEIDASGRAHAHAPPLDRTRLVLHLPDDEREPAMILGLPRAASAAQRATCDLLVRGRTELVEAEAP